MSKQSTGVDTSPTYWAEYSNLQKVKHDLIRNYLGGWFPKLGSWAGRIIYLDTHAGRGSYASGELGSPLVAIKTLLEHRYTPILLQKCEIVFFLIERDEDNRANLNAEIQKLGTLPPQVHIQTESGDCFEALRQVIQSFKQNGKTLAPAFIFLDPYGFKIPGSILAELMSFPKVELFINIIWRELDMAMRQGNKMKATLDSIFNGLDWQSRVNAENFDKRADQTVQLFKEITNAKWATYIRMLGDTGATRYMLAHFTNHDAGRDLMKDCIWKVCPDGGFYARKTDNPNQEVLISPTPNLSPLRTWVLNQLQNGPIRWQNLIEKVRPEIWREPHLNEVIRELRNEKIIRGEQYTGRFGPTSNPILRMETN